MPISEVREISVPARRLRGAAGTGATAGGTGMVSMLDKALGSCSWLGGGLVDRGEDRVLLARRCEGVVEAAVPEDQDAVAEQAEVGDLGGGDEHGRAGLGDAVQSAQQVLARL